MSLIEQLQAERRERADAANELIRRENDPDRFRSDADRARLASTDTARIVAEQALNDALRANLEVERSVQALNQEDGHSLYFRDLSPSRMTPEAAKYVQRGRAAQEAIQEAKERLQEAIREHNTAVREIDAAAAARRRAKKVEAGQLP